MAVAYRSHVGNGISANDNDGYTIPAEPSGAAQDDILLLFWLGDSGATQSTAPTGWTEIYSRNNGSNLYSVRVWWIRRGASAPSLTIPWTGSLQYHEFILSAFSGAKNTGNPWTNAPTTAAGTSVNPANPNPASIVTAVSNTLVVAAGMGWAGAVTGTDWGTPSGYTKREGSTVDQGSWSLFDKAVASASTEDPETITGSTTGSSGWDAITIALEPEGVTPINISPGIGSLTAAGLAPTRLVDYARAPGLAQLTAAGFAPAFLERGLRYAYPTTDTLAGAWTPSTGTTLFDMIDEATPSDTDYIVTNTTGKCKIKLLPVTDPASSSGHVFNYRIWSPVTGNAVVRLIQGASTLIAEWTHTGLPSVATTYSEVLTTGQADAITNYDDLYIEFEAT